MKKIVSLLLTLALLCCSVFPALAEESTTPTITVTEFCSAMDQLAAEFIGWEMEWLNEDGILGGNLGTNPILLTDGDYVTLALVSFTVGADEDADTIADLFIIVSALTAACPAVRDGYSVEEAPDMVFGELRSILATLTTESPMAFGTLYGASTMISLTENEDGSVDMSMMLIYNNPNEAE